MPGEGHWQGEGGQAGLAYSGQLPVGKGELHRLLQPRDAALSHCDAHHGVVQDLSCLVGFLQRGSAARAELGGGKCWWQHEGCWQCQPVP